MRKGFGVEQIFLIFLCDLIDHTQKRIFIGFDAHFSFPEFMVSDHVQDMWKVVDDICQDQNDFYAGSFPTAEPYSEYYMRSKNDIGRKYQGTFVPARLIVQNIK